jgi:hypothetical protein
LEQLALLSAVYAVLDPTLLLVLLLAQQLLLVGRSPLLALPPIPLLLALLERFPL